MQPTPGARPALRGPRRHSRRHDLAQAHHPRLSGDELGKGRGEHAPQRAPDRPKRGQTTESDPRSTIPHQDRGRNRRACVGPTGLTQAAGSLP